MAESPCKEGDKLKEEVKNEVKEMATDMESAYSTFFFNYVKLFSKRLLSWLTIYAVGFFNLSFGWLMAPLFFLVLREKRAKAKKFNFDVVRSIANTDEKEFIQAIQRYTSLPSWVTFPDMERVEWLNQIVYKLWPYAGQYVKDLCDEFIEPAIAEALKAYKINTFKFEKIILGDTPPRFGGIKVYDDTSRHEIILDCDMVYAGDCKFEVAISKLKAGIKDLQIAGRIRVVMKPLVRQIPLVGGLQVFFLNNPDVDFNLIGLADVFDMPGISDILRSIVVDQIAALMVLPNRYPIQLVEDINVVELKCPAPAGVLRVQVLEAQNLMKKDIGLLGTGKSDPYCVLRLGAQKFQTKTINNTVNPKWDFCCEFLMHNFRGQELYFEIYDLDSGSLNVDDPIGRANLDVESIWKSGEVDMWVPLAEAKSGRIHIRATWLDLSNVATDLDQQLAYIRQLQGTTKNPLHSAVLMVWVDSAKKLNPSHKQIPDPFVRVRVGNNVQETTVQLRTNDPVFEEGFTFLVRSPLTQEMLLEVLDHKTGNIQGRVELDLNQLLSKPGLEVVDEEYTLSGAVGGLAAVKLTLTLRILKKGRHHAADSVTTTPEKTAALTKEPSTTDGTTTDDTTTATDTDTTAIKTAAVVTAPPSSDSKSASSGEDEAASSTAGTVAAPPSAAAPKTPPPSPARGTSPAVEADAAAAASHGSSSSSSSMLEQREDDSGGAKGVTAAAAAVFTPLLAGSQVPVPALRHRTNAAAGEYGLGRIQLTIKYGPRNNLVIVVHKIAYLEKEDDGELPDPYVKVYLLPDRSKDSKRKTDVIKDSCSPVYDERFEYSLQANELTQRTLEVSIVNKKGFFHLQKSNVMGQVEIDCGLLDPNNMTKWYDLQPATEDSDE